MKEPIIENLTKSLIESIIPKEIIYAEAAGGGAMGNNAGGIMLYLIKEDTLMCYKTNIITDEVIYMEVEELLLKHQDRFIYPDIELQDKLFDYYYGGMGNNVFINTNITLEIKDGFFIYKKDNIDYQILPSVEGIFDSVACIMRASKSD